MNTLHIACAADDAYVPHTATMIRSVLDSEPEGAVCVHFLHGPRLSAEARAGLTAMVAKAGAEIEFAEVSDERVGGLRTGDGWPSPIWYRVFLPELLSTLDRILYLDGDLLVLDSLRELWATDLSDCYVAAVTNIFQPDHLHHVENLGLPDPSAYFNSGVLLMNLDALRRDDCAQSLLTYARANAERLRCPDQDVLNVVLGERRLALHPRWNCMTSVLRFPQARAIFGDAVDEARADPAIRHFEGPGANKPWHFLSEPGAAELYESYRRRTPWPEFRPEGRSLGNLVRRLGRRFRVRA